jgi:uncharacterized repeat protein (TIGR01451 family)
MHRIPRAKASSGRTALPSLLLGIVLLLGLLGASASLSAAQTADTDKVSVRKVAAQDPINAGQTATFTITVTTQPFPIDGVVLTDVLPTGLTWTVSGADAVAAGCAGTYAGGSTLVCNFGNLGDFGVVVTKTVTVSGQTTVANCGVINNRAHVDAAASEGETDLSNNDSSASITVLCQATPTPTPPPSAKITPTGTTCQQFRDGTAADLNAILYNVRDSGSIGNVAPGIGFYFVALPGAGTYTISQSDNGNTPAFGVQSVQVYFGANCDRDHAASVSGTSGGGATISVSGARIVRLAFDPNTVVGTANPAPQPTIVYQYTTSGVAGSTDTINLTRNS